MKQIKNFSRAVIAIALMLGVGLHSPAHDFEVDGIYYNITSETDKAVEVTFRGNFTGDSNGEYYGNIVIPDTVNFNNITYIVAGIGKSAFYDNKNSDITSITIGNNITYIEGFAFDNCDGLTSLVFSDNVSIIGENALQACINLSSITFGKSISSIGNNALYGLQSLKTVIWNSVNCPNFAKTPFSYNPTGITSFSFGNSVEHIPANLCNGLSALTSITIPKSVKSIGDMAFNGCNFSKVYARPTIPPTITATTFTSNIYENATLYVYENSSDIYMADEYWQNFFNVSTLSGGEEIPQIYLKIIFPESGIITHKEEYNESVDLSIVANEGWKVNNVTFNDEDVTSQLDAEGNYTTPVLTDDATLAVVFEKEEEGGTTEIETLSVSNDIKVYTSNGVVRIVGVEEDANVVIYDVIGRVIYSGNAMSITISKSGVYVLTVANKTFKFAI